jgi:hypothetical protein
MKPEHLSAEHNSFVTPGIKLEFVLEEMQKLRQSDPKRAQYIFFHIARARKIMAKEMQKCVDVGIDIENAKSEKVDAIIEKLFVRFVCQSPS